MTVQLFYPYGQGEASLALSDLERKTVLEEVVAMKKQGFPILNSAGRLTAMINNDGAAMTIFSSMSILMAPSLRVVMSRAGADQLPELRFFSRFRGVGRPGPFSGIAEGGMVDFPEVITLMI